MRLVVLSLLLAVPVFGLFPSGTLLAQGNIFDKGCEGAQNSTLCKDAKSNQDPFLGPNGLFADILQLITIAVGVAAVIMIIIGGIKYITSGGDPASVSSAKNTLLYAVIGIVVVLFAQALVLFVIRRI